MNRSVIRHSAAARFSSDLAASASSISSIRLGDRDIAGQYYERGVKIGLRAPGELSVKAGLTGAVPPAAPSLLAADLFALRLPRLVGGLVGGIRRIEAEDRLPLAHFLGDEGLEQILL